MHGSRSIAGAFACALITVAAATALAGGGNALTPIDQDVDGVGGVDGVAAAYGSAVSPDGEHLYAIGYDDSAVAAFKRTNAGKLNFIEAEVDGAGGGDFLSHPAAIAVAPGGRQVYVVTTSDDSLVTFARNPSTGKIRFERALRDGVNGVDGLAGTCCQLAVSRDGRNVYVPASADDGVSIFKRNRRTGKLSYVGIRKNGVGGVSGLANTTGVIVSPDGEHVYAIGEQDDAIVAFKRKGKKGNLKFIGVRRDGVGGVSGMAGPCCSLAISRDGRTVIVPGESDVALAVFRRKPRTGKLRFVRDYESTAPGFGDMIDPIDVVISRDGRRVWVASYDNSTVLALKRTRKGRLSVLDVIDDGDPGADMLTGVWRLTESPDGKHVYASGYDDNAIVSFRRE